MSSAYTSPPSTPVCVAYKGKATQGPARSILNQVSTKIFGTLDEAEQPQDDDSNFPACKDISAKLQLFIVCRLGK